MFADVVILKLVLGKYFCDVEAKFPFCIKSFLFADVEILKLVLGRYS